MCLHYIHRKGKMNGEMGCVDEGLAFGSREYAPIAEISLKLYLF